ncbi:GTPase-associated system all-helical protein GASH [Alcaligenes aquatilis]|uniref:GTPase-associated system helical domain-containing protein n=1 Tax=Alcaligenes aquatilis TaxID=323284 RepID=A0A3G2HSW7_9BURK|nr:GTPase-associated system all-helical protein GASH [Alcaligenes aquatilis]AYN20105.1 hypothetical protein D3M96_05915 [Alcaligenes aquatilis]
MAKTPEMNAGFVQMYAELFMSDADVTAARWKGVVDTAAVADHVTVEVLVRYAFATKAPAQGLKNEALGEEHQAVLNSISGDDSPIDPAAAGRELQVLCAAVLEQLFSTMPDAAIAVLNASFGNMRRVDLPMDLPTLAERALARLSQKKRARPDVKEFQVVAPKIDFEVSEEAMAAMSVDQWKLELERLRDVARTATRAIVDEQNRVAKLLVRRMSLSDEELQMLWWLIGGHSDVAGAPFAKVEGALRPLAFGGELGQLTEVSPGPASVTSLLSRAGISDDMLTILDAVNAADMDWTKEITESSRISPVTTPLHFALEKKSEIGSSDAWLPVWIAMTGLPEDASMPAIKLAELFYREYLFLHVNG